MNEVMKRRDKTRQMATDDLDSMDAEELRDYAYENLYEHYDNLHPQDFETTWAKYEENSHDH